MIARNFDEAFSHIQKLVQEFRQNEAQFLSPAYNETAVREVFINRFWMALGWDVTHETQKNPHACEVSVEKNVNVEGRGKRADYSFAVAPNYRDVRFFVEAKKPSRQLDNAQDYFQTMRYGWHARTPIAVLMDFEQFRALDCRYKPDVDLVLEYGALEKFHYTDYADEEKFRRLYHLFSREDVGRGALEEYVAGLPKPGRRGGGVQGALFAKGAYQSIDESFLQDLDGYREQLARAFKQGNAQLDGAQLTEATQRTLDRLVFMRFLEDKLIETDELVERFAQSRAPWAEFVSASRRLDRTYNGIIFKEHPLLDAPAFRVDERAFASICENLSHTRSPYDFNLIPIHILGSIYERFLGKTIVVDAGGATVVEKPEVRKAGGVYYTPEYIVRYIVEQTVGKLIAGKTPEEIRALRFADISCGSGSFLLGVFDSLLAYHAGYYNRNKRTRAEGLKAGCTETDEGTLRLSLLQKRTILLNNIYGVDVDAQAVEVAQLSLYLKLLEAETTLTTRTHQLAFREALLPSLGKNIISGNSLIDFDILSGHLFEPEEERKLNPMNFAQEFPHVIRAGGFDAIVGNPPYDVLEKDRRASSWPHTALTDYVRIKPEYKFALGGKLNLFRFFIVQALSLVRQEGRIGMIVPLALLADISCAQTRRHLMLSTSELEADCFPQKDDRKRRVFLDAKLSTLIFTGTRKPSSAKSAQLNLRTFPANNFEDDFRGCLIRFADTALIDPVNMPIPLVDAESWKLCTHIHSSNSIIRLGDEASFSVTRGEINQTIFREFIKDDSSLARLLKGVEVGRYLLRSKLSQGHREWFDERKFLRTNNAKPIIHKQRIATQRITGVDERLRLVATLIEPPAYFADSTNSITLAKSSPYHLQYLLGLLNSKLFQWRFKLTSTNNNVGTNELESMPFRTINFSDAADKARHERMVSLVEGMLAAKRQLAGAGTEAERNLYERKCANLDAQIDALVYELYALTPREIALVEAV